MSFGTYPPGALQPITPDNIDQMRELGSLEVPETVTGIKYSPDGKYLAIRLERRIVLWNMLTDQPHLTLDHNGWWIETFAFTPDGKTLLSSSGSPFTKTTPGSTLHHWDVETGQEIYTWKPSTGFVSALAFNPQNPEMFALISYERSPSPVSDTGITISNVGIELWNGKHLTQRFTDFKQFHSEIGLNQLNTHLLKISPDGKTLYVCFDNGIGQGQVLAWAELDNGELRAVGEPGECWFELTLNREGNYLATTNSPEGKLFVRDLRSGSIIYADTDTVYCPYRPQFNPPGSILSINRISRDQSSTEYRLDFVDLPNRKTVKQLNAKSIGDVDFSADNTILAVEMGRKIVLWGIPQ